MDEAPDHGADLIEEVGGFLGLFGIEHSCGVEESEEGVYFHCGSIGDAPMMQTIPPKSALAFTEVCRN